MHTFSNFEQPYELVHGNDCTTGLFIRTASSDWMTESSVKVEGQLSGSSRVKFAVLTSSVGRKDIQLHHPRAFTCQLSSPSCWEAETAHEETDVTVSLTNWFFIYRQLLFTILCRNGFWVMLNIHNVALLCIISHDPVSDHLMICRSKAVRVKLKLAYIWAKISHFFSFVFSLFFLLKVPCGVQKVLFTSVYKHLQRRFFKSFKSCIVCAFLGKLLPFFAHHRR